MQSSDAGAFREPYGRERSGSVVLHKHLMVCSLPIGFKERIFGFGSDPMPGVTLVVIVF